MKISKSLAGIAALSAAMTLCVAGSASADPAAPSDTALVATGSDTTQDVMTGLATAINTAAGSTVIANYDATPVGSTITTRAGDPDCVFTRPRNSGDGRDALSAALRAASFGGGNPGGTVVSSPNMTGCVDVARMSSFSNPTTSPGVGTMTYIPFAIDSLTFATLTSSTVPKKLNITTLQAIYKANGTPGSAACFNFAPLLPAAGSGTRGFWRTVMGVTTDTIGVTGGWGTCVKDTTAAGTTIQEHDGRFLTASNQLLPFSTAQFISQQSGTQSDIRGRASLGSIDWDNAGGNPAVSPVQMQTSFGQGTREVYNVVSTAALGTNTTLANTFSGATSSVCTNAATIQLYGFAVDPNCGSTQLKNSN